MATPEALPLCNQYLLPGLSTAETDLALCALSYHLSSMLQGDDSDMAARENLALAAVQQPSSEAYENLKSQKLALGDSHHSLGVAIVQYADAAETLWQHRTTGDFYLIMAEDDIANIRAAVRFFGTAGVMRASRASRPETSQPVDFETVKLHADGLFAYLQQITKPLDERMRKPPEDTGSHREDVSLGQHPDA